MRVSNPGAPVLVGVLSLFSMPASAHADFPTQTNVDVKVGESVAEDGAGVIRIRPNVQGDSAVCTGTLHLVVRHAGEVVVHRTRPISEKNKVRFRVGGLDAGRHQATRHRVRPIRQRWSDSAGRIAPVG